MANLGRALVDLLLPPTCSGCGGALSPSREPSARCAAALERVLCLECRARFSFLPVDACASCQEIPVRGQLTDRSLPARCRRCVASSSALDSCTARVGFDSEAEKWIHAFKYPAPGLRGLRPGWDEVTIGLAIEAAARVPGGRPDLVIPIPLHARRQRARGFNPAAVLARQIAGKVGSRFSAGELQRLRDTPSQTGLGRRGRRENVRAAFWRIGGHLPPHIWIVDDVVTTGSTLEEAARVLRRGGAQNVHGVAAARAIRLER